MQFSREIKRLITNRMTAKREYSTLSAGRLIMKSKVWFCNNSFDFTPNCTPFSVITIINSTPICSITVINGINNSKVYFNKDSKICFHRLLGRVIRFNYVSSNDEKQHDEQQMKELRIFMRENKV